MSMMNTSVIEEKERLPNDDSLELLPPTLKLNPSIVKKKSFINRGELMKNLKFPSNNMNLVVIPSNEKGTGFLRTCYD